MLQRSVNNNKCLPSPTKYLAPTPREGASRQSVAATPSSPPWPRSQTTSRVAHPIETIYRPSAATLPVARPTSRCRNYGITQPSLRIQPRPVAQADQGGAGEAAEGRLQPQRCRDSKSRNAGNEVVRSKLPRRVRESQRRTRELPRRDSIVDGCLPRANRPQSQGSDKDAGRQCQEGGDCAAGE